MVPLVVVTVRPVTTTATSTTLCMRSNKIKNNNDATVTNRRDEGANDNDIDDIIFIATIECSASNKKNGASLTWEEEEETPLQHSFNKERLSSPFSLAVDPLSEIAASPPPPTVPLKNDAIFKVPNDIQVLRSFLLLGLVAAATVGLVTFYNTLLMELEWMQAWRYTWPCVGLIFMYEGYQSLAAPRQQQQGQQVPNNNYSGINYNYSNFDNSDTADSSRSIFSLPTDLVRDTVALQEGAPAGSSSRPPPVWFRIVAILAGASLVIGGAADAFLPVYVTGPEFLTAAGLAPDAAAFLATFQAFALVRRVVGFNNNQNQANLAIVCVAHILLLSQLLVLGAGSFYDTSTLIMERVDATFGI